MFTHSLNGEKTISKEVAVPPPLASDYSGGIAGYKALELIRLLRKEGASVRCVLTEAGARFVTALSFRGRFCARGR